MKYRIVSYVLLSVFLLGNLSSCTIRKRVHRPGFHVDWWTGNTQNKIKTTADNKIKTVKDTTRITLAIPRTHFSGSKSAVNSYSVFVKSNFKKTGIEPNPVKTDNNIKPRKHVKKVISHPYVEIINSLTVIWAFLAIISLIYTGTYAGLIALFVILIFNITFFMVYKTIKDSFLFPDTYDTNEIKYLVYPALVLHILALLIYIFFVQHFLGYVFLIGYLLLLIDLFRAKQNIANDTPTIPNHPTPPSEQHKDSENNKDNNQQENQIIDSKKRSLYEGLAILFFMLFGLFYLPIILFFHPIIFLIFLLLAFGFALQSFLTYKKSPTTVKFPVFSFLILLVTIPLLIGVLAILFMALLI